VPVTMVDTEVAVLTERETLGEGAGDEELDGDWASTVARKANPKRTAARKRG